MTTIRLVSTIAVALSLAITAPASAQFRLLGMDVDGQVEVGGRFFIDEPEKERKGYLEEYRDLPEGPFLSALRLRLMTPDQAYSTEFAGRLWGQEDQEFSLRTGRLGLWDFSFEWDQTPHLYSTNSRFLATETRRGVYRLPDAVQTLAALPVHNDAPRIDIEQRWDTARIGLAFTPTPALDLTAEYTRINKDGEKPFGMGFGSPGGNFYEILEPIEQTVHDFRLAATFARERWQVQASYAFSSFDNSLQRVVADNPVSALFGPFVPSATGGTSTAALGAVALAPDNMAHTFNLAGGVTLPFRTRLTANVGYSIRMQDADFVPHTVNPVIAAAAPAGALALPRQDLDGIVGALNANITATSRPFRPLTLTLKYRVFDYDDMSEEPIFPAHVVNDQTLVLDSRRAGRYEHTRHNVDLDTRWQLLRPVAVTVGTGWERWDRNEHREVPTSDELFGKLAVDVRPLDWLSTSIVYKPSFRRIAGYDTFAHLAHSIPEDDLTGAIPTSQSTLLRKYDQAERDRHAVEASVQVVPFETMTATVIGGWHKDDYVSSRLGLQEAEGFTVGLDLGWTPRRGLTFSIGYVREVTDRLMRSRERSRSFVPPIVVTDVFENEWTSEMTDIVDTAYVNAKVEIVRNVLDWTVGVNVSDATGRVDNANPSRPLSATAIAPRWPSFHDTLIRAETALRYHFLKRWTAGLGYTFESFEEDDWRTDGLKPFVPGTGNVIWLGSDLKNYAAHIVAVTLGYRF